MTQGMEGAHDGSGTRPLIVGVAGGSGSGKTTVVERIVESVGAQSVARIQHDCYYRDFGHLPPEERARINFDHPDSLESELLAAHLDKLIAGGSIEAPTYDFTEHTRCEATQTVGPARVVIVDGILILAEPELRRRFDVRIFVDTDADVRLLRRLRRDLEERGRTLQSVIQQYEQTVRPMHLEFVEPSKRYADVIVPRGGENVVAIEMVAAHLRRMGLR